jgi:hypothetical protein
MGRLMNGRPRWLIVGERIYNFMRGYRSPYEAVANRRWLFDTFGITGRKKRGSHR